MYDLSCTSDLNSVESIWVYCNYFYKIFSIQSYVFICIYTQFIKYKKNFSFVTRKSFYKDGQLSVLKLMIFCDAFLDLIVILFCQQDFYLVVHLNHISTVIAISSFQTETVIMIFFPHINNHDNRIRVKTKWHLTVLLQIEICLLDF